MSYKILTKNGIENTNIDGSRGEYFNSGMRSGIVKGVLNEGIFTTNASNSVYLDTCELRICGHRILIDDPIHKTFANVPSINTEYSFIAQIIVDDTGDVNFSIIIQSSATELIQEHLYKKLNGSGRYQLEIGRFTIKTDGTLCDVVRTAPIITVDVDRYHNDIEIIKNDLDCLEKNDVKQDKILSFAVLTSPQTLTPTQQSQVRQNIGASATSMQGSYDDVKNQILNELAVSNNNLLINGDFQVNQRGQETYTKPSTSGLFYTFDRWCVYSQTAYNSSITKIENGIRISNEVSGMNFFQIVEMDWNLLLNKSVTLSAKINGEVSSITAQLPSIIPTEQNTNFKTLQKNGYAIRIEIRRSNNISYLCAGLYCGGCILDIEYLKLEFGDKATPFNHKTYAEELASCQRYYQSVEGYRVGVCSPRTDNQIRGCMQYITKMRSRPTITQLQLLDMFNLTKSKLESQTEINIAPVFTPRESSALVALGSYTDLILGDILVPNSSDICFALDAEIY